MSDKNTIDAVVLAVKILKTIADNRAPMRQSEVAAALGINRAQALRHCETLAGCGMLDEVSGAYGLGGTSARLYARYMAKITAQRDALQREIDDLEAGR